MMWTEEQDDVIRELSFLGAQEVADEIFRRCGVARTATSVTVRASRIHCSLAVQTVCPSCGAVGLKINRQTRMCPRCSARYHVERERAFNEQLEAERKEAMAEAGELERQAGALRAQNSRLCRKYHLPGRRGRGAAGEAEAGPEGGGAA